MTLGPDFRLIAVLAPSQLIGWGTMFSVFPLFGTEMEAALGWSRATVNAGFTLAILVSGVLAVPVGRVVDRQGGRAIMTLGGLLAAGLLALWSVVDTRAAYWALWVGMGAAQAATLWIPAMAVVVATARDATRTIAGITFLTGFTGTVFIPFGAWLIEALGWRDALLVLAALQAAGAVLTLALPRAAPRGPAAAGDNGAFKRTLRGKKFWALAVCFAAHAFLGIGLAAHAIPLLRERGLPEATVLLVVALHGPFQVAARVVLFALGQRVTMRSVGRLATLLLPAAMLVLALAPPAFAPLVIYALAWAIADGLMTIVRAAGTAEILGREGYGAITGALSAVTVLPRTAAPIALALIWQWSGGYAPVPWLLAVVGIVAAIAFFVAARPTRHSFG